METEHLRLIPCDVDILKSALDGNNQLAKRLGVTVEENWTEFGVGALQYSLERLEENPAAYGWWTYLPVHKQDNRLIGSGGYKGCPTEEGTVELGYEIAPSYRNKGLATEMATALVLNAFADARVKLVTAHTLGEENASTKVLAKCGFKRIEEINDPEDGLLWKWERQRS